MYLEVGDCPLIRTHLSACGETLLFGTNGLFRKYQSLKMIVGSKDAEHAAHRSQRSIL
jgi:hypothetical protein